MKIKRIVWACYFFGIMGLFFLAAISQIEHRSAAQSTSPDQRLKILEDAYRANNRGVAQLEQFNPAEAVKEFRKALEIYPELKIARVNLAIALFNTQDIDQAREAAETALKAAPDILQTHYMLGLIARNQNETDDALASFQRVLSADPNDVGSNVNVGQIYTHQRRYDDAIVAFRRAYDSEPYNSTAIYNLATALIRNEKREEGQKLIEKFQALRQSGAATSIGQNYLEQGRYAEALVSTGAEPELVDPVSPKVSFRSSRAGVPTSPARSVLLFDYDNDNDLDLLAINRASLKLFRNDVSEFTDVSSLSGAVSRFRATLITGAVAGDFDNDSFEDVLVFGRGRPTLFRGDGKGGFVNVTNDANFPLLTGSYATAAFVDIDHDGDLDIFLGSAAPTSSNKLFRNNGDKTFSDVSIAAKITSNARAVAIVPTDFDNRRDVDLLVLNYGNRPSLFQNLRDGTFRDVAREVGLDVTGKWTSAAAGDFNKDSFTDFYLGREDGPGKLVVSDGKGRFTIQDAPAITSGSVSAQFIDFDNDGLLDLVTTNRTGLVAVRNFGTRWLPAESIVEKNAHALLTNGKFASGDLDRDGDIDLVFAGNSGPLQFLKNAGAEVHRSAVIALKGRVSNRSGIGSKIDIRSGSLSQKLETYSASPMPAPSDIHFGLGKRQAPDAVRIIWPSGVIQAEVDLPQGNAGVREPYAIEELDRKPSSCPYLYSWNGEEFEFITDFLGGGEMGNWKERGAYHFPDSDEFVRIPSDKLKPKDGRYEIRVTNELEEVLFLDHLKLIAVEHPVGTEIYPNEGMGIPTSGQRIIYTTKAERPPLAAIDSSGRNVLERVRETDHNFYDSFQPTNIRGYAEQHSLTLVLDDRKGYNGRTLLLLTGWTDYAFSSDNLAASQSGRSLSFPKLQVKNKRGEWQTVVDSIGISVGRPQTVVLDLTGKFLTDSREVRIVTNVKTYWDKIAVDTSEQKSISKKELPAARADLRERGYSYERSYTGMIVPAYERVLNDARWKYFSGTFTRTGDVKLLLDAVDDVFVISRTGDELVLSFDALPEPPAGRKFTFLLFADGYSKEMDINSGSPEAVLPLPFKRMTRYPYGAGERFPMTVEKQRLYDEYTTRVITKPLPGIEAALLR